MWGTDLERRQFGELWPLWYGADPVVRNYKLAVARLRVLADGGYAPAQFAVGLAHFDGTGARRDYSESFRCCLAAAQQDYPAAANMVGGFYASTSPQHDACPLDPPEAVRWYRRAAELGNAGAQFNLANSYRSGYGIAAEPVESYVWATLAILCSPIRNRPAEVLRDQIAHELDAQQRASADARASDLKGRVLRPWSEHVHYWKILAQQAGALSS